MVTEDFSDYEIYDLPTGKDLVKKDPIKKNQINLMAPQAKEQTVGAGSKPTAAKNQA